MIKHALKQVYKYDKCDTNYYCNFLGKAGFKKGLYDKRMFESTKDVTFEKVVLKAPILLEEFLERRFGDYQKIPSDSQIKWEQHAWKWDVNNDYSKYIKTYKLFKDEKRLI